LRIIEKEKMEMSVWASLC